MEVIDVADRISVLLADDSYQIRQGIKAMLSLEQDQFVVAGEAETGRQAMEMAALLKPDVILMDVNMPEMDGLTATERIMASGPTGIVMISVQGEQEYLRRAMKAGAADYLVKPFTSADLAAAIRSAAGRRLPAAAVPPAITPALSQPAGGKVVTVFSTKGGVGKTTLAANLAASVARLTKLKVAALDLDLEFGALGTVLGARPAGTIADLCRLETTITPEHVSRVLVKQPQCSLWTLCAPLHPHLAAEVEGDARADRNRCYVAEVIDALRRCHDYVIIDTASNFRETNLVSFDKSDLILVVTLPEVPALETTAKGLDVLLERLEYPAEKVALVLNRADGGMGLKEEEIERSLGVRFRYRVPGDGTVAVQAGNEGLPFVLRRHRPPIADAVDEMARSVAAIGQVQTAQARGRTERSRLPALTGLARALRLL
jgi:pilus assembly protein CpaE